MIGLNCSTANCRNPSSAISSSSALCHARKAALVSSLPALDSERVLKASRLASQRSIYNYGRAWPSTGWGRSDASGIFSSWGPLSDLKTVVFSEQCVQNKHHGVTSCSTTSYHHFSPNQPKMVFIFLHTGGNTHTHRHTQTHTIALLESVAQQRLTTLR